jgi:hypothetical protein
MHFQERLKAINDWRTIAPLKVKTFDASVAHRWSKGAPIDLHDCEDERSSCSVFLEFARFFARLPPPSPRHLIAIARRLRQQLEG